MNKIETAPVEVKEDIGIDMLKSLELTTSDLMFLAFYTGVPIDKITKIHIFDSNNINEDITTYVTSIPVIYWQIKKYTPPNEIETDEKYYIAASSDAYELLFTYLFAILNEYKELPADIKIIDILSAKISNYIRGEQLISAQTKKEEKDFALIRKTIQPLHYEQIKRSATKAGFKYEKKVKENYYTIYWDKPFIIGNEIEKLTYPNGIKFIIDKNFRIKELIVPLENGLEVSSKWFKMSLLPHISSTNEFCFGDNTILYEQATTYKLVDLFFNMIKMNMFNYNAASPYISVSKLRHLFNSLQKIWDRKDPNFVEKHKAILCVCGWTYSSLLSEGMECTNPTCRNNPNAILKCEKCGGGKKYDKETKHWKCNSLFCPDNIKIERLKCLVCGRELSLSGNCNCSPDVMQALASDYIVTYNKETKKFINVFDKVQVCPKCGEALSYSPYDKMKSCINERCANYNIKLANYYGQMFDGTKPTYLNTGKLANNVCPECGEQLITNIDIYNGMPQYETCMNTGCGSFKKNIYYKRKFETATELSRNYKIYIEGLKFRKLNKYGIYGTSPDSIIESIISNVHIKLMLDREYIQKLCTLGRQDAEEIKIMKDLLNHLIVLEFDKEKAVKEVSGLIEQTYEPEGIIKDIYAKFVYKFMQIIGAKNFHDRRFVFAYLFGKPMNNGKFFGTHKDNEYSIYSADIIRASGNYVDYAYNVDCGYSYVDVYYKSLIRCLDIFKNNMREAYNINFEINMEVM